MTGRQFNQDTSGAKRAAADGPVFITDRGEPSHVLMTMEDYRNVSDFRDAGVALLDPWEDERR